MKLGQSMEGQNHNLWMIYHSPNYRDIMYLAQGLPSQIYAQPGSSQQRMLILIGFVWSESLVICHWSSLFIFDTDCQVVEKVLLLTDWHQAVGSGYGSLYKLNYLNQEKTNLFMQINQDDLGSRKKCEELAIQCMKEGRDVIIDRCNFDILQRHTWIKLATLNNVTW
jgi:hypothetical protein